MLFGNERQQSIHKSHFSQININEKEIVVLQHFNNCKRYIKNDSNKTEKVYEIKGEIVLEKVNGIKKEVDQKLVIS